MSSSPSSPRRRRVLSSINPAPSSRQENERRSESRAQRPKTTFREPQAQSAESSPGDGKDDNNTYGTKVAAAAGDDDDNDGPLRPRRSRLKLRSSGRRRRRHRSRSRHRDGDESREKAAPRDSEARSSHRRRHRHRSAPREETPEIPGPPPLDPETPFRESLFDAMADDEAASYWEHVYGQPIHVYSNERVGPQGELERMTDEEYAAYVRQKMFEKTHAGLLEDEALREEKRQRRQRERQESHQRRREYDERASRTHKLHDEVEQSLRRGEARRLRKDWDARWATYVGNWAAWDGRPAKLPWPVRSGRREDMSEGEVRSFFVEGLDIKVAGERALAAQLKEERVRWHPDKIQQRLGGVVEDDIMRYVTTAFQIIDRLWQQTR